MGVVVYDYMVKKPLPFAFAVLNQKQRAQNVLRNAPCEIDYVKKSFFT